MILNYTRFLAFIFFTVGLLLLESSCKKEEPVDTCDTTNCLNGGVCVDGTCFCPPGYMGEQCETADPCYQVNCLNGGGCIEGTCSCPSGFTGDSCQIALSVQQRLDSGDESPIELYQAGVSWDSLMGKEYEGGYIGYIDTAELLMNIEGIVVYGDPSSSWWGLSFVRPWGCPGESIAGLNYVYNDPPANGHETIIGARIGDGRHNTNALLTAAPEEDCIYPVFAHYAANTCDQISYNGKSDWFLPSRGELREVLANLALLEVEYEGYLEFWSSTAGKDDNSAWNVNLYGEAVEFYRTTSRSVLPIRYF